MKWAKVCVSVVNVKKEKKPPHKLRKLLQFATQCNADIIRRMYTRTLGYVGNSRHVGFSVFFICTCSCTHRKTSSLLLFVGLMDIVLGEKKRVSYADFVYIYYDIQNVRVIDVISYVFRVHCKIVTREPPPPPSPGISDYFSGRKLNV